MKYQIYHRKKDSPNSRATYIETEDWDDYTILSHRMFALNLNERSPNLANQDLITRETTRRDLADCFTSMKISEPNFRTDNIRHKTMWDEIQKINATLRASMNVEKRPKRKQEDIESNLSKLGKFDLKESKKKQMSKKSCDGAGVSNFETDLGNRNLFDYDSSKSAGLSPLVKPYVETSGYGNVRGQRPFRQRQSGPRSSYYNSGNFVPKGPRRAGRSSSDQTQS